MFGTRKSALAVALTVIALLAMLVPVASAAPEWVHGVTITAPTTAAPKYVNPELAGVPGDPDKNTDNIFKITYDLDVVGTQVDNVHVQYTLLQAYDVDWIGKAILTVGEDILAKDLGTGVNHRTFWFTVDDSKALDGSGEVEDGWYALKICTRDIDPLRDTFCTVQEDAILVQDSMPKVDLEKPGAEDWEGATFVTGKDYLLVGLARDVWGIVKAEFQYCDASNAPGCAIDSPSWITIAAGTKTADVTPVEGGKTWEQYEATWDSSAVPDDFGFIRMCVWNHVGLSNCAASPDPWDQPRPDAHKVFVNNRAVIHLEPGWNLISLPLMPYNTAIDSVLMHLINHNSVGSVQSYDAAAKTWTAWNLVGPKNLTDMMDGVGYWVYMRAEDDLTVVGTWKNVGNVVPPEYPVFESWNLIGYTHWGTPTFFPNKTVASYLSTNSPALKAMWRYDAEHEVYVQTVWGDAMRQGAGYWLALNEAGSINP